MKKTDFEHPDLLHELCHRLCHEPFSRTTSPSRLWLELWPLLDQKGRRLLVDTPDPCLNHVESRLRKPERAGHLKEGLKRLLEHDQALTLEALRLYPHALCRSAEAVGPVDRAGWERLAAGLGDHRLWKVKPALDEAEFWETVEGLRPYRDLPQLILDFLDSDRPREDAPVEAFKASLHRFLVRERIEKVRHSVYELLRRHDAWAREA